MKNTQAPAKSAVITLRAGGTTLTLLASVKADGTAVSSVTTTDADKKKSRGMSESHTDMAAATTHLAALAKKAEGLGWTRRARASKPDAFNTLPAAPKATAAKK